MCHNGLIHFLHTSVSTFILCKISQLNRMKLYVENGSRADRYLYMYLQLCVRMRLCISRYIIYRIVFVNV